MGTHLTEEIPFITAKQQTVERFGVPEKVYYPQWFDITFTGDRNDVLAYFKISVNAKGDSVLRNYNLKPVFPAVIEHKSDYKFYYFGGDFAENKVNNKTAFFEGYHNIVSIFSGTNYKTTNKFYWQFYIPMMTYILDDYYKTLEK